MLYVPAPTNPPEEWEHAAIGPSAAKLAGRQVFRALKREAEKQRRQTRPRRRVRGLVA